MDENNSIPYGYEPPEPVPMPPAQPEPVQPPPYAYNTQGFPPPWPAGAYYPPPQPPVQPPAPKRRRGGLVAFSVLVVLAVVVGIFVGAAVYRGTRPEPPDRPGATDLAGTKDDSRLELAQTPTENSTPSPEGPLTPVQIHNKLKDSNVAVQLYSGRASDRAVSEGSGILLHEDGTHTYTYVLTCAHVINKNERVSVELADGTAFDAAIVGYDNHTDVGLLRIKATGLKGAEFGDSDKLQVGEAVYAIGNPGGIEFMGSFTPGMVSAIDRPLSGRYTKQTIQHTAPINPGNSGGALVNSYGQVVGVNSMKIMDVEYEGMGFAIPSKVVQGVVNNLISKGYVPDRPKLGIEYLAASESQKGMLVMRINNLPSGSLIIATINEDSDIVGTDIRANDIITHVNGEPLNKASVLLQVIDKGKVGDKLELTIARVNADYSITSFDVTVKLVEDKGPAAPMEESQPWWNDDERTPGGYGFPWDW